MNEPSSLRICIIDDDPFIVDMYVLKFQEQGFTVETAGDGRMGIDKIREIKPHAILIDVVMPGMDGFAVFQEIQKEQLIPKPKIVFLTNFGQKEDVDRGIAMGADAYIIKAQFTPSEVVEKVKTLLA